jgi:hypothetical protein
MSDIINQVTTRVIEMLASEFEKPEIQTLVRHKLITPLTGLIYRELYPYIMAVSLTILTIFLLSLLTFICFLLYYLKQR